MYFYTIVLNFKSVGKRVEREREKGTKYKTDPQLQTKSEFHSQKPEFPKQTTMNFCMASKTIFLKSFTFSRTSNEG